MSDSTNQPNTCRDIIVWKHEPMWKRIILYQTSNLYKDIEPIFNKIEEERAHINPRILRRGPIAQIALGIIVQMAIRRVGDKQMDYGV